MSSENLLESTAVIIRCWNNPHVEKRVREYLEMGVGLVCVVVNSTPDKRSTRSWLTKIKDERLVILDIFEGYNWVPALNRAVMAIHMANLGGRNIKFVLSASVEAVFGKKHVLAMLREFADDSVGIVGTNFDARKNSNPIITGRSYRHPRNTGMVIRLSVIGVTLGAFDAWCDTVGGMEDIDFTIAMLALSVLKPMMLDLKVRLVVGVNYDQATKEKREQEAMDKIIARWRSLFVEDTPQRQRIDDVITKMGLETP